MLPLAPQQPIFPDAATWSRALFVEAVRHLEDASVLHAAARYAGSLASTLKAAELGLKSVVVLDGAMGWWEKLHTTHTPFADISGHPILRRHAELLQGHSPTLPGLLRELEALAPGRPGADSFQIAVEANPEYPFFSADSDPHTRTLIPAVHSPAHYFGEVASRRYFNVARNLLTALQTLYPAVGAWAVPLPAVL